MLPSDSCFEEQLQRVREIRARWPNPPSHGGSIALSTAPHLNGAPHMNLWRDGDDLHVRWRSVPSGADAPVWCSPEGDAIVAARRFSDELSRFDRDRQGPAFAKKRNALAELLSYSCCCWRPTIGGVGSPAVWHPVFVRKPCRRISSWHLQLWSM